MSNDNDFVCMCCCYYYSDDLKHTHTHIFSTHTRLQKRIFSFSAHNCVTHKQRDRRILNEESSSLFSKTYRVSSCGVHTCKDVLLEPQLICVCVCMCIQASPKSKNKEKVREREREREIKTNIIVCKKQIKQHQLELVI